jgi:putative oxidoreductase
MKRAPLRRLFSTFATGLPGAGLLVMRLVAGTTLSYRGCMALVGNLALGPTPVVVFQIIIGMLLLVGLWTPVAGTLLAMLEILHLFMLTGDPWIHILLLTLGVSLTLLGPGGWSVDARLFGWKRVEIPNRRGS